MNSSLIIQAARLIANADGLLITAGAGMGVDSGLPDFRGNEGFWNAYPALAKSGIDFTSIANPRAFMSNPRQAWGFYGHRLALYRKTVPHEGFQILRSIVRKMPQGAFVVTSNIDGQFQKAGFSEDAIFEIHGSIHFLQCIKPCRYEIWSSQAIEPAIDEECCEWLGELPTCPHCGSIVRPNVLMFNDATWIAEHSYEQEKNWQAWTADVKKLVVIEMGAGVDIPSIRIISENQRFPLIRINPRHDAFNEAGVSLPMGAKSALIAIATELDIHQ
jgi:NAD-dependent SIR2 family protein deacetylase